MPTENPQTTTTPSLVLQDGVCNIKNFGFASGETISELRLHYSTLGTPQYDAQGQICNAVLLLHSSTGNLKGAFIPFDTIYPIFGRMLRGCGAGIRPKQQGFSRNDGSN